NNTIISNNHAGDAGGGIDTDGTGTVLINNSQVTGNTDIHQGAGVYIDVAAGSSVLKGANMRMTGTVVSNNSALANDITASGGSGGALFANGTTLILQSSTFAGNTSAGNGGAIEVETTGTGTAGSKITDTTITGNSALNNAGANGGGIDAVTAPGSTTPFGSLALLNDT